MAKDYYEILGVPRTASPDEVKKAYRKLAHQHHPDTGKGDEARFKEVNEAYSVIGNADKRSQYDRFGNADFSSAAAGSRAGGSQGGGFQDFEDIFQGFGGFADFGDIFSDVFGGGRGRRAARDRGIDVETRIGITFTESFYGVEKEITITKFDACLRCKGSGAEPGKSVITCPRCHGQGSIRTTQNTIFGSMAVSQVCDRCGGMGKVPEEPCKECSGSGREKRPKTVRIKIPAGIDNGNRIRIAGEGEVGYLGSAPGDLYLRVFVEPDPRFRREGDDIYSQVTISFPRAALGEKMETDTVEGRVELKIPAGTQSGSVFRLRSLGMPRLNRSGRGDQFVTVNVEVPRKLSREQKKLLEELKELS
ncbi:MAG: molecular chaperone DnaJ [Candidatus Doudnabacteria bacterium RIFCSPHIGHO2_02_FULL_46_11]|uniref:Chaperone protein DnaJ n=1 Tax=Candidatus Doudnabacteria bacterium RIFCSPHIGHO2_02_FULL_46_11 TaxID=1817832 RepID=A0A1F5P6R0_9BACT|nr:MAG: molecular chaperone DnaJ [Candidatus Doudnabacteria bacterium RIFCSPHIGHO2_02_FULL_46_11]